MQVIFVNFVAMLYGIKIALIQNQGLDEKKEIHNNKNQNKSQETKDNQEVIKI